MSESEKTKYLDLIKQGLFFSSLKKWREEHPNERPRLAGVYLVEADLKGGDLSGIVLTNAELRFAILSGANLSYADLEEAHLFEADLAGADLHSSNLTKASLASANLSNANLSNSYLEDAHLVDAQLTGAKFYQSEMLGTNLTGATLVNADLREARLRSAKLINCDLTGADLTGADLTDAQLAGARLPSAILKGADLSAADLRRAVLDGADLSGAYLTEANLFQASFRNSNLSEATLMGAAAVTTDFTGANLSGCRVYGISAWDANLDGALQSKLVITRFEPHVQVDNLEVAQFIYLLLNRRKLRNVLTTLGEKTVLVLGRFTERKELLDGIAEKLRTLGYLPVIFDFERPTDRDVTETVKILAGLSLFVIADITNPRSVPLELQATVPDYMVPFVTIVQRGHPVFGMFDDLPGKYNWALPLLEYNTADSLLAAFEQKVVAPALEKLEEVRRRKALPPKRRSAED